MNDEQTKHAIGIKKRPMTTPEKEDRERNKKMFNLFYHL